MPCDSSGHPGAAGLANAVLRRFVRERGALFARLDRTLATRTAHPSWLVERLQQAWPKRGPAAARRRQCTPADDAARGPVAHQRAASTSHACRKPILVHRRYSGCHLALLLDHPRAVSQLPGFDEGLVSVQDSGAQLAAGLLQRAARNARAGWLRGTRRQDRSPAGGGRWRARPDRARCQRRARRADPPEPRAAATHGPHAGRGSRRTASLSGTGAVTSGSWWTRRAPPRA